MEAKLVVLVGKAKGREIPLPSSQFIIGRSGQCHLRPHSELVSKYHCAIVSTGQQVVVRDLKSRNCTFVNGEPITKPVRVKNDDILAVGPLRFRFSIDPSEDRAPVKRLKEDHVLWLIESSDAFDLDSSSETQVVDLPPEFCDPDADTATATPDDAAADAQTQAGGQNLSAGKYLRDYFERKRDRSED